MYKSLAILVLLSSLVTLSQVAVAETTLPELLLQHREAMGGDDALKAINTIHTKMHYSMMMIEGSLDVNQAAPDKNRVTLDSPIVMFTEATDGNIKWKKDQNGQITKSDDESKLASPNPVLPEFQYLFPNDEITVIDVGTEEVDGKEYRVLEVNAPGFKKVRRKYLDPETYLLSREDLEEGGIGIVVEYSDYKKFDGLMIATKVVQNVAVPGLPPTVLTVEEVTFNEPVDMTIFNLPGSEEKDYMFPESNSVMVPLEVRGEHLFIEAKINGQGPYLFLLDSGAASTIIDTSFADSLNLDSTEGMHVVGVGGAEQSSKIDVDELAIGEFKIEKLNLFSMNLAEIGTMLGFDSLNGIVGYDLFARAVVKLDYQKKTVTIIDPEHFTYEGPGKAVAGEIINNLINIDGVVDGDIIGKLRIDTGAAGGLHLHGGFLRERGLLDRYKGEVEVELMGAGGSQMLQLVKVKNLKLGEFEVIEPLTTLMTSKDGEEGIMGTLEAIGTVGNQVLSKFVIYFDYENNQLILEPTETLSKKTAQNRAGLIFQESDDGSVNVVQVLQGSPGEKAGFEPGDKVLQLAKLKPGKGLTAETANRMLFSRADVTYRVKIQRQGSVKKLKLKLSDLAI